jgi:hypothetical protein
MIDWLIEHAFWLAIGSTTGLVILGLVFLPQTLAIWNALPAWLRWLLVGLSAGVLWGLQMVSANQRRAREAEARRQREATAESNRLRDAKDKEINALDKSDLEKRAGRWVKP